MGEKMIFWRDQKGHLSAAVDRCPHRGAALSLGKIQSDHIQCPFHGFEFESSGKCVLVPANGRKGVVPNALKLASFHTGKSRVLAFKKSFHGRTSAAVAATDDPKIVAPINAQQMVDFVELGDLDSVESILRNGETCAVIVETIQGIGGLDESTTNFYKGLEKLCREHGTLFIADEIQCGYGRTGDFFAFQMHGDRKSVV